MQWVWACLLCLSGQYGKLLDYVIFAVLVFYVLTIVGLFVLRTDAAGCAAAVQGVWVSGAAGAVHRDGDVDLWCTVAIQASIHMAGIVAGAAGRAGVCRLA
jgi:hypothetical protein